MSNHIPQQQMDQPQYLTDAIMRECERRRWEEERSENDYEGGGNMYLTSRDMALCQKRREEIEREKYERDRELYGDDNDSQSQRLAFYQKTTEFFPADRFDEEENKLVVDTSCSIYPSSSANSSSSVYPSSSAESSNSIYPTYPSPCDRLVKVVKPPGGLTFSDDPALSDDPAASAGGSAAFVAAISCDSAASSGDSAAPFGVPAFFGVPVPPKDYELLADHELPDEVRVALVAPPGGVNPYTLYL